MPSLWDLIKDKSSIPSGTTYEHLVSPVTTTRIVENIDLEYILVNMDLEISQPIDIELIDIEYEIEINEDNIDIEVSDGN